jgi:hypothetical protein
MMHAFIRRERKALSHRITAVIGSVMAVSMRPRFWGPWSKLLIHENLIIRRFGKFHVPGLAGKVIARLAPIPFHLDDAAIYFSDGAQLIAILARNTLAYLPV